jgi:vacuole morphology and inheritance protein 14
MARKNLGQSNVSAISMQAIGAGTQVRPQIPADLLRRLADKAYERRWLAASELQLWVQGLAENGERETLQTSVLFFKTDFLESQSDLNKLGGLLAYAAFALGMADFECCTDLYEELIPPVLNYFKDPAFSFYAVETMHNITKLKASHSHVLKCLGELLTLMIGMFADVDLHVKQAVQQLDLALKAIVVETEADPNQLDRTALMALLGEKLRSVRNPNALPMLVTWLMVLHSVPGFQLTQYLGTFLDGLFRLLATQYQEVQQTTLNALHELLCDLKVSLRELPFVTATLARLCSEGESLVRLQALHWLEELLLVSGRSMLPDFAEMLDAATACLLDPSSEVVISAEKLQLCMRELVEHLEPQSADELKEVVNVVLQHIESSATESLLGWLDSLYRLSPETLRSELDRFLQVLMSRLTQSSGDGLELTLSALCLLSTYEGYFARVLDLLLEMFETHVTVLESVGDVILLFLCSKLGAERVYCTLADLLSRVPNEKFSRKVVELMDLLLLTEDGLEELRAVLRLCFSEAKALTLFEQLFRTWCLNPVSCLGLCLLAQAYDLAYDMLLILSKAKATVEVLTQLARLVQVLETPVFALLRMQMLDPQQHPYLLRALYGLLMLLPQSKAYVTLECRLSAAVILRPVLIDSSNES